MKKTRKILAMAACAVLLVCISVGATVAYLTSTDEVKNTFTVGKVAIVLDEQDVKTDGTKDTDTRVDANEYHLMPGHKYIKDPIVHFAANSEASWLFVKVENEIAAIEDGYVYGKNDDGSDKKGTIEEQIVANGWTALGTSYPNIYYKKVDANSTDAAVDYKVFDGFAIKGELANNALASYAPTTTVGPDGESTTTYKTINITAYAVQQDGFDTAVAAWTATFGASKS